MTDTIFLIVIIILIMCIPMYWLDQVRRVENEFRDYWYKEAVEARKDYFELVRKMLLSDDEKKQKD